MEVFNFITDLNSYLVSQRKKDHKIGLVPTMGALHEGHLSLVRSAVGQNDVVVASIFVNPAQFNNKQDYEKYPNSLEDDLALLESEGIQAVFNPSADEMYPADLNFSFDPGDIGDELEGRFRPGHFKGVAKAVYRLFEIVDPDSAYFGQKDLQQFAIVKRLRERMGAKVDLMMIPTVRNSSGLAMSSRNRRLDDSGTQLASLLYRSLERGSDLLLNGQSILETKALIAADFAAEPRMELEYFEVVDSSEFKPLSNIGEEKELALCIACYVDGIRLIDNTLLNLR